MEPSSEIKYKIGNQIDIDIVLDLYVQSTLGERRPVNDLACMAQMVSQSNLVITAWDGELLVGIARSLTDFCYVAYLADLAVRQSHQRKGIGKMLIGRTQAELGPNATVVLLAAPAAEKYYPHIGMKRHHSAWVIPADLSPE